MSRVKVAPTYGLFLNLIGHFSEFPTILLAPVLIANQYLWLCNDMEGSNSEMGGNPQEPLKIGRVIGVPF